MSLRLYERRQKPRELIAEMVRVHSCAESFFKGVKQAINSCYRDVAQFGRARDLES